MIEQLQLQIPSFNDLYLAQRAQPGISNMINQGDIQVYEFLDRFLDEAFDYRDSMDLENHITGVEVARNLALSETGKMLYLASSYGMGPALLRGIGYQVYSADTDFSALYFAKNYTGPQINADAQHLPIKDTSFSTVISRDFLAQDYHLLEPYEQITAAREIHRILIPGGKAIFYTLYSKETEREDGTPITQGLPNTNLLTLFRRTQQINVSYQDRPGKNSIAYVATK